ncbi:hypothetical protein V8C34DRAFT_197190 [Trichoderma compactum]
MLSHVINTCRFRAPNRRPRTCLYLYTFVNCNMPATIYIIFFSLNMTSPVNLPSNVLLQQASPRNASLSLFSNPLMGPPRRPSQVPSLRPILRQHAEHPSILYRAIQTTFSFSLAKNPLPPKSPSICETAAKKKAELVNNASCYVCGFKMPNHAGSGTKQNPRAVSV